MVNLGCIASCYSQLCYIVSSFDMWSRQSRCYCMSFRGAYHLCFSYRSYMVVAGYILLGICYTVCGVTRISYVVDMGYNYIYGCTSLMLVL